VVADLPGTGTAFLPTSAVEALTTACGSPIGAESLLSVLDSELGMGWSAREGLQALAPARRVREAERRLGLGGWVPWWRDAALAPGFGAQLVIVACHLDSTASMSNGYQPATSPAPGADDNASGIACTLAAARELTSMRGALTHTVRFCFFNAEEQGLRGSAAYASLMKSTGAPIKAVICIDMVGYRSGSAATFEIHAGAADPAVRDASVPIAEAVARWAGELTTLAPAQIYKGTLQAEQADRDLYDPAIGRADHASFHAEGYPAVVVSEDYFVNRSGEPPKAPNPNYHRFGDTAIDATYAADIARAVARAAQELAQ
jgi:hypothetical protein